ncbi:MAG: leucine-rich repeat domain-containing protein [Saprospirales bacterium]|nr:leucine-rich repeat domain-containing protein [Saprospirales bacterium]
MLSCYETQVSDLTPLAKLSNLEELYCSHTLVSDLTLLAKLTKLRQINCSLTQVSDLAPLANLSNLQELECYSTKVSDLSALAKLTNLQELKFYLTQVSDLAPLVNLTKLQKLDCDHSQVSDLTPLSGLTNLQNLHCSSTQVSDLTPLSGLTNLQNLHCSSTQVSDLTPLSGLTNLQNLNCSSTQVSDLSPLVNLINLEGLYFYSTQVSDLKPLASLTNLKRLAYSSEQLSDLTPLANLTNLRELRCPSTQVSDLTTLANLSNLQVLECSFTRVSDLSPLANLSNLQVLDCCSTQVSDLSLFRTKIETGIPVKWLAWYDHRNEDNNTDWRKRPAILVRNCPLIIPAVEFAQESPQAVRDYFEELGDNSSRLNEVKVIFLGEASAGKTSLVKRLIGEDFDSKESQTHGIRIRRAPFKMDDGDTVTAHLWDFGGQEVMHATHQFFLSQRSVYVLLLNSRNDDQAEKWLRHAASFGGRSPVLVVLNKIDENPSFEVNRKTLKEKYPQIRDFYRVSARSRDGIDVFREALRSEIDRADTRCTPFPPHWLAVKMHFSNMEADYIEEAEYHRVCVQHGVLRPLSQEVLLQFLHDLGVVINFRNLKNFGTQILNPLWLTNGVYRIINSEIVANTGGLLREADFDAVINDPRYHKSNAGDRVFEYPKNKLLYIVRVMQEFELCFPLDACTYVVPQLLPVPEPDFKPEGAMLRFVIHFPEFLPDSLFPRLMVKLHTFIRAGEDKHLIMWRKGMVLHKPNIFNALAQVRWDKEDQKILVDVCGDERRRFLSFIRETIKEIIGNFTNVNFSELVPIPGSKEFLEYEGLVEAEKAKKEEIFVWQVKKDLKIKDLLDGVEEPAMRDEMEQLPVRAFVSYAHADLEYLKELRNALSPLIRLNRLQLWDDRNIDAGAEWEKDIFQQLEESDIVLCLVSADFVASDFCYKKEFGAAADAHRRGEKTIVPIWLRQCDLEDSPIAAFQSTNNQWIASAKNKDEVWTKVSKALRPVLDKIKQRKKAQLDERRKMK